MRVEAWVVPSTGVARDVLERRELEFGESWSSVRVGKLRIGVPNFFSNIFFFSKIFFGIEVGNPGVVSVGVGVSSTLGAT